ncbi:MAG: S8 family serine peptidase [Methylohalobius sp.]|nr:S8 family serine peptidase [Methylohalobius sp.]
MFPTGEILVKLKPGQKIEELVARYATWGLEVQEKLWGTQDEYVLKLQNLKAIDPLEAANVLFESGLVEWAEPNFAQEVQKSFTPNDPFFPLQWHLNNLTKPQADVDAPKAWDISQGSPNTVIAIIDDGVELNHPDLVDNIFSNPRELLNGRDDDGNSFVDDLWGWDFRDNDNNPNPSLFDDDHGTAVAGVAAARGNNWIGVSGVCPRCKILPIRIGFGFFFTNDKAANAIRYAASLADVLNNSWGGGAPSSVIQSAIRDAVTRGRGGKGSVVLSAAGNYASGYELISVSGLPAGTHRFRWVYSKDFLFSSGEDTAWLGWVQFPGGQVENFEAGAARWLTGGNAPWRIVNDPAHADEGACFTHALKAGAIGHNQSSWVEIVKAVPAGDLHYFAWVSSELGFDGLRVYIDLYNNGTFDRFGEFQSGEPDVVPGVSYPAAYPESIAVGASSDLDCRSYYSQFGEDLDFVEPSNGGFFNRDIYTTDRTGFWGYDFFSDYALFGGTSSATPVASGIVGLLLSKNPNLTQAQVRQILRDTADKIGPSPYINGRNDRYGFGRVNAFNALNAADSMTCPPIQGEITVNHIFKTILFAASCENPVVIVGPPTYHDTQPGVIRLHNVNQNGFDIRFQEWNYLDGKHASEYVPYLVLRQGRHTMSDGSVWEVGTFALDGTGTWIAKNFTAPFAGAPVLFLTVQTANDAQPVMVRARNVTPIGFEAALFEEEALMNGHSTETIGYLAIYNPKGWGSIDFRGTQVPYLIQRLGVNHLFAPVLSSNLKLEEEQSKDLETNHVVERVWALALGDKLFAQVVSFNGPDTIALRRIAPKYERSIEWGIVHGVNHDWVQVPLAKTYANPVVVAKPASSVGPDPGVVRLKEVTTRSFQVRYQEWDYLDGRHLPEKIFYLVADSGAYNVGGLTVNAGKTNSSALSRLGQWKTISFSTTFTSSPVVLSAVQTVNDSDAVTTRLRNISSTGMQIAMDEQEGKNDGHTSETLGWIAIAQGGGATSDGRRLMASLLDGVTHVPSFMSFFTSLTRIYPIVVSDLATVRESDPVFLRYQNPTSSSIELYLQEEQSADIEISHVAEKVGVFIAE